MLKIGDRVIKVRGDLLKDKVGTVVHIHAGSVYEDTIICIKIDGIEQWFRGYAKRWGIYQTKYDYEVDA